MGFCVCVSVETLAKLSDLNDHLEAKSFSFLEMSEKRIRRQQAKNAQLR